MLMSRLFSTIKGVFSPDKKLKRSRDEMEKDAMDESERRKENETVTEEEDDRQGHLTRTETEKGGTPEADQMLLLSSFGIERGYKWRKFPSPSMVKKPGICQKTRADLPASPPGSAVRMMEVCGGLVV